MADIKNFIIDENTFFDNKTKYIDLIGSFYKNNGDNFKDLNIEDMIKNKHVCYGVILTDDKIVCLCRFAKVYDRKTIYCIRQINTLKEYQNKGYAVMCYETIQNYLQTKNAKRLISFVANDNFNSQRLHEKCNYKKIQPTKTIKNTNYYFDNSICYEKKI